MSYKFSFRERLHLQKDFQQTLKLGRRLTHPAILIYMHKRGDEDSSSRLGLITSRKVGNAVCRNRTKRRLREIFRLNKHRLEPGIDMIFMLKPGTPKLNYNDLEAVVLTLWTNAGVLKI